MDKLVVDIMLDNLCERKWKTERHKYYAESECEYYDICDLVKRLAKAIRWLSIKRYDRAILGKRVSNG